MRILSVRFRNLNSLSGQWFIDLQAPDYAADGIFAITGPTGAGKTTILDAICLALYGQTPRLKSVSKGENEIMSRQTGDCFAEVVFATAAGRFRCHWSQHRAKHKASGALQNPRHEFCNHDTGQVLASKLNDVATQVEQVTGMDFRRFTRSMLLAQGDFAAFLQASPSDRADILEQITGTTIYSDISKRVHERLGQEDEALEKLRGEMAGISLLSAEEVCQTEQKLAQTQENETILTQELETTRQARAWISGMEDLQREIDALTQDAVALEREEAAFAPQRIRLERATQAAALGEDHATLTGLRKQQAEERGRLQQDEATLPALEAKASQLQGALQQAVQETGTAKAAQEAARPRLADMRSLDQQLAQRRDMLATMQTEGKDARKALDAAQETLDQKKKACRSAQEQLERLDTWLHDNARDGWLVGGFAGIREQLKQLAAMQDTLAQLDDACRNATSAVERATNEYGERQKDMHACEQAAQLATQRLQQSQLTLEHLFQGRTFSDLEREREEVVREMVRLHSIADLAEHRARLQDGQACPLCGATEHPYAEGNVPAPDTADLRLEALDKRISDIKNQETTRSENERLAQQARADCATASIRLDASLTAKKQADEALDVCVAKRDQQQTELATLAGSIAAQLLPLGVEDMAGVDFGALTDALQQRLDTWQAQSRRKDEQREKVQTARHEQETQEAVVGQKQDVLQEKRDRYEAANKALDVLARTRRERYGNCDADREEEQLAKAIHVAEAAEKTAREAHVAVQLDLAATRERIANLQRTIAQRTPALQAREDNFARELADRSFVDEAQFLEYRMPDEQRTVLDGQARELDKQRTSLQTLLDAKRKQLAAEQARQLTQETPAALLAQEEEQRAALRAAQEAIAGFRQQLRAHNEAKNLCAAKETAITAQQREWARWKNLHNLIGSADGKKFRNFAQGLTFDLMVGHANRQLQKMSDRYILVRDAKQPLELNVLDKYQAGEQRSTRNLSGGESFIVSLALALGLSHMASRNVRLDSLFLDEGFGTLDEDTLDTALNTLAALQQDGKLIGVISHVAALVDRIGVQIRVTPGTGGRSRLEGPGCGPDPAWTDA